MAASIVVEVESGASKLQPRLHNGYWAGSFRNDEVYLSAALVNQVGDIRWQAAANILSQMTKPA